MLFLDNSLVNRLRPGLSAGADETNRSVSLVCELS